LTQLTVANSSGLVSEPYLLWGIEQGYFEEVGIDVVSASGGSSTDRVAGLSGGSFDISTLDVLNFLASRGAGNFDGVVVGALYGLSEEEINRALEQPAFDGELVLQTAFVLAPGLSLEELKQQEAPRVSRRSALSTTGLGLTAFLEETGFNPETVDWVTLPAADDQLNALLGGEVDGALLTGAHVYAALEEGASLIAYPAAYWMEPGPFMMWVASRERVQEDPDSLYRFQQAMYKTARELNRPDTRSAFNDFLVEQFDLSDEALQQFVAPPLSTQSDVAADFEYLPEKMLETGFFSGVTGLTEAEFLEAEVDG
jgi:NitT/TauT family transport system substrate-binding protein